MTPTFRFAVRVYYEDTDAGGVVYHSNYLRFMERARSEWLSHLGLEHAPLAERYGLLFVVRSAQIEFQRPARLSDLLDVELRVARARRSSIVFAQRILRGAECLTTAEITVVAVSASTFRPCAMPPPVLAALQPWLPADAAA
jgi:acyl-CoA thioester hydrolase